MTARSPVLQMVSEVLTGLSTVRAFRKQRSTHATVEAMLDAQGRCLRCNNTIRRWLELRLEAFGSVVVLVVALSASVQEALSIDSTGGGGGGGGGKGRGGANAALLGLSLSYALKTTAFLKGFMTSMADAELGLVSLERLQQYADDEERADHLKVGRVRQRRAEGGEERCGLTERRW